MSKGACFEVYGKCCLEVVAFCGEPIFLTVFDVKCYNGRTTKLDWNPGPTLIRTSKQGKLTINNIAKIHTYTCGIIQFFHPSC